MFGQVARIHADQGTEGGSQVSQTFNFANERTIFLHSTHTLQIAAAEVYFMFQFSQTTEATGSGL